MWVYLVGWLFGFYGISTFVGYLMPNPFLCTQFNCQKHLFQANQFIQTVLIQLSIDFVYTQLNVKTVLF